MTLEDLYESHCKSGTAIAAHLPRLRALAEDLELAIEFGVKRGASSTALLLGARNVISLDIVETPQARALEDLAGGRWQYRIEDSRRATLPACDLLFLDSHHSYSQVQDELAAHAHKVRRFLVFHDTITFGSIAANGETGRHAWQYETGQTVPRPHLGIRPAIDHYLIQDDSWRIKFHFIDSHGLLVLERR